MFVLGSRHACCLLERWMTSSLYQHALGMTYFNTLCYYGLQDDEVMFQQDSTACHTSSDLTYNWIDKKHDLYKTLLAMRYPGSKSYRAALIWDQVALGKISQQAIQCQSTTERFDFEWNEFKQNTIERYYYSYLKRICTVIKARGGYTSF